MRIVGAILMATTWPVAGCTPEARPIHYGHDHCHVCSMTVVDQTHAAQHVTKKGKNHAFDSIECMVRSLDSEVGEFSAAEMAFILVTDYAAPGTLVDAKIATYLISEDIKSPMGANLSAFKSADAAKAAQAEHHGRLFTWDQLRDELKK